MYNMEYKCIWCDFKSYRIRGLKYHAFLKHRLLRYSIYKSKSILGGITSNVEKKDLLVAAISYMPKHISNKDNMKRSVKIIKDNMGTEIKRDVMHFK